MKRIILLISLFSLSALQPFSLSASQPVSLFTQGNEVYKQGDYQQAAQLYEQYLVENPKIANAYYNLGNAYFKQGDLSHAILAYERCLRIDPRNKDCKHNLAFAKTQIIDNVEDNTFILSSWAIAIRNLLTGETWQIISLIFWLLALSCCPIIRRTPMPQIKKGATITFFVAILLSCITFINAQSLHRRDTLRKEAIITQGIVNAKASPDRSGTELFTLHEGTKITIDETLGDWSNIHVGNHVGWIPTSNLERI